MGVRCVWVCVCNRQAEGRVKEGERKDEMAQKSNFLDVFLV